MSEPADVTAPEPPAPRPPPPAEPRRDRRPLLIAVAAGAVLVVAIAAAPFWAPAVIESLPWGTPQAKPAAPAAAAAPDPALAALKAEAERNAAAVQQLGQRLAALEARPAAAPPDLSSIEQRLGALDKTTADLTQSVTALDKAAARRPAVDPTYTALALVLAEIREAIEIGRPFETEYGQLAALARSHAELAAAVAPLAGPAQSGVASRAVLAERLRQLAPEIATAKPPPEPTWTSQIVAQLRSLVTIRHIAGEAQTPTEAAIGTAQQAIASGDLAGAVAALDRLDGPSQAAAQPWLQMAKQRLAVEAALRQIQAALVTALGNAAPAGSGPADAGPAGSGPAGSGPAGSGPADSGPADSGKGG